MDSCQQHDQFVERFVRSQDRIYAYVTTLLPNRADAEEVFQQTSLILWKKWQQFAPSRDFVRWACGMAHHEVRNFLRKHADKGRVYLSEDVLGEVAQVRLESHDMLEARRHALRHCLDQLGALLFTPGVQPLFELVEHEEDLLPGRQAASLAETGERFHQAQIAGHGGTAFAQAFQEPGLGLAGRGFHVDRHDLLRLRQTGQEACLDQRRLAAALVGMVEGFGHLGHDFRALFGRRPVTLEPRFRSQPSTNFETR
jgi:RNA polymerase sigma factor (sigma-70 family)